MSKSTRTRRTNLEEHKIIYALTITQIPGSTFTWTNPRSQQTFTWTVPEDGHVLFYIGESSMTLPERLSKHKTFAKKLVKHLEREEVLTMEDCEEKRLWLAANPPIIDPHHYPVYYFTKHFCGDLGQTFEAHLLQDGPGLTEADWIKTSLETGHPIQNAAKGSYSTKVGGRKDDGTVLGEFRRVNEAHFKPKKKAEPTEEEIVQARLAWIAERKAREGAN